MFSRILAPPQHSINLIHTKRRRLELYYLLKRKQLSRASLPHQTIAYVLMDDQESEIGLFPSGGLHTCSWLFPSGGFSCRSCSKRAFIRCSVSTIFISRFMAVVVKPVAQPRSYKSTIILSDSSLSEQLNLSTTRAFLLAHSSTDRVIATLIASTPLSNSRRHIQSAFNLEKKQHHMEHVKDESGERSGEDL